MRGKIFATLWPEDRRAVVKLPRDVQLGLVEGQPEAFSLTGWSKQGWTGVDLKRVGVGEFGALIEESWRQVAPKTLVPSRRSGAKARRKK